MSLCSPYFKALFTTKLSGEIRWAFCIPGITENVMREMMEFAYSGSVEVTEQNVKDLLIGADQFNIIGMLKKCCEFLLDRMCYENCIGIRSFARQYFCFDLEKESHNFLMCHFVEVVEVSNEFLEMSLEQVVELLNSDFINVRNEESVWEAGFKWIEHHPEVRKAHMEYILRSVRLGLLQTQYFMDNIQHHKYIENVENCRSIVRATLKFLWDLQDIGELTGEVETPFLATPRIPYSMLFTIGGWSGGTATSLMETYDTKADRWIQVDVRDPVGPRAYHKLAVIGYDIYVIGGFDGSEYYNNCSCFNACTKIWKEAAPMHWKRCYVSVATENNLIYAMGGYDGQHRQNTVERYDPHSNQWTLITSMNMQRSDASAASLNGLIYIVGGFNGAECLSSGEFYDPVTDIWTTVASMHHRRSGVCIISHHNHIFALGGFNGISRLSSAERYDPITEEWKDIPEMFNPRSNFAVEVMDDMIFVIGGFNGVSTIFHVECFDDRTNEWFEATDMNSTRSALAACVVPGLPNVGDYVHQNRSGLMEEKRQKLLQERTRELQRVTFRHDLRPPPGMLVQERDIDEPE